MENVPTAGDKTFNGDVVGNAKVLYMLRVQTSSVLIESMGEMEKMFVCHEMNVRAAADRSPSICSRCSDGAKLRDAGTSNMH